MEFVIGFILGVAATAGMFIGYGYFTLRKLRKTRDKIINDLKSKFTEQDIQRESIIARLKQAQAITEQQLEIRDATDQPSKNALHSRYKNDLIYDVKKLEEEKIAILRSILDDGFDPTISVVDDAGNKQELPLSHFVNKSAPPAPPTEGSEGPKRVGKFTVVKGGKDDGTVH